MKAMLRGWAFFLLLITILGVTMPVAAQDEEAPQIHITQIDNSNFPKITVYLSVTNAAGEPLGVDPHQIELYENGERIQADQVSGEGEIGPLTTMLVMDVSGSMNEAGKLRSAQDAAKAYVDQMRPGDQAGLMIFNTGVKYVQEITGDQGVLVQAIDNLKAHDDTAMYDALNRAADILKKVEGRKAIIAITDGLDNASKVTPDQLIEAIGPGGLSISTIGLGNPGETGANSGLDEATLKSLAERAGGLYGYANDPEALSTLFERYARALQSEYTITYTSASILRDGVNRSLTVKLASLGEAQAAQASYNPGGVLPEVLQSVSWPIFLLMLGGLLVLLLLPWLFTHGTQLVQTVSSSVKSSQRNNGKGGKVKAGEQPPARRANIKLK